MERTLATNGRKQIPEVDIKLKQEGKEKDGDTGTTGQIYEDVMGNNTQTM